MKKYKACKVGVIWLLLLCLLFSGCTGQKEEAEYRSEGNEVSGSDVLAGTETLKVLLAIDTRPSRTNMGSYEEYNYVGDMLVAQESVITKLVREYGTERGINVSISYDGIDIGETTKGYTYDVVILDNSQNNNSELADFNMQNCYDLTTFFEEDGLYDGDAYVLPVIEAGQVDGWQLLFPLTFNMSMLFASAESLEQNNLYFSENPSFDDLVMQFKNAYQNASDNKMMLWQPYYFPLRGYWWEQLWRDTPEFTDARTVRVGAASPANTFAESSGKPLITEDEALYDSILEMYEAFVASDLGMSVDSIRNRQIPEDFLYDSQVCDMSRLLSSDVDDKFDMIYSKIACFTSTDARGVSLPFAAQALYYESRYTDFNQDFVCTAIPRQDQNDAYAAMVTAYGFVPSHSKEPELGFELLKYVADHQTSPIHDMSVNRDCIDQVFTSLTDSVFSFTDVTSLNATDGSGNLKLISPYTYEARKMSFETKMYLEKVIDHINYAYLMDISGEGEIWLEMDRYITGEPGGLS